MLWMLYTIKYARYVEVCMAFEIKIPLVRSLREILRDFVVLGNLSHDGDLNHSYKQIPPDCNSRMAPSCARNIFLRHPIRREIISSVFISRVGRFSDDRITRELGFLLLAASYLLNVDLGSCSALHSRLPPSYEQTTALANLLEMCYQKKLTQVSRYASVCRILGLDRTGWLLWKGRDGGKYLLHLLRPPSKALAALTDHEAYPEPPASIRFICTWWTYYCVVNYISLCGCLRMQASELVGLYQRKVH